ncbi:MAG: hypothetical protein SFY70_10305 [Bacteroidia bacterium]|nr:hypothetical protein [Bacteroidia bacterium]
MRRVYIGVLWLSWVLPAAAQDRPPVWVEDLPIRTTYFLAGRPVGYKEMPRYQRSIFSHGVALACDYADYHLLNPLAWDSSAQGREVHEIDLVYSHYPADTNQWRTPFGYLMTQRIRRIQALDPRFSAPTIRWNLVAQTDCRTEAQAKALFHGFVVKYRVQLTDLERPDPLQLQELYFQITKQLMGGPDLVGGVLHTFLARRPEADSLEVVLDCTSSMYTHTAELFNWLRHTPRPGALRRVLLFNDGDDFLHPNRFERQKPIGQTGGFYPIDRPDDFEAVVKTLELCLFNGDGTEGTENDLEALLFAQGRLAPGAPQRLLLIADNSPIRDIELLDRLTVPVDVFIVDPDRQLGVHSDYLSIAWYTGGTVYTPKGDIAFAEPHKPIPSVGLQFLGQTYRQESRRERLRNPKEPEAPQTMNPYR